MKQRRLPLILYILLAVPFFKPAIFGVMEEFSLLETVFDLWRLAATAAIALLYLLKMWKEKKRPSLVLVLLGLYLFFVLLSTVLGAENYWSVINYVLSIFGFCVLLELALWESADTALDMIFYPMTVLVWCNFLLECIYPRGLCVGGTYSYSYNFLGIDNFIGPMLIPYMILTAVRSVRRTGDLDWVSYMMIGVCTLNILFDWSATALMGMAVAVIFLLFIFGRRLEIFFNGLTALAVGLGMFLFIVLLRLQDLFAWFIEGVLHKGLSFTGRTDIWDIAITMIAEKPILGWGWGSRGKIYRVLKGKYYHAHNVYLEVMMEGGILAMIPFLGAQLASAWKLMKYRKEPCARILSAGLMAAAVMTTMEPYLDTNGLLIYALVILGYHIDKLASEKASCPAEGEFLPGQ